MTDLVTRPTAQPLVADAEVSVYRQPPVDRPLPIVPAMIIGQCSVLLVIGCIGRAVGVW